MNQNEILAEANNLVSNGLRKAAIDLLREYLETDPESPKVLSMLGRAYLLDRQPEMAVTYLKRSLEISQRSRAATQDRSGYGANDFDDDDMAYVESQAVEAQDDTFSFEDGEGVCSNVRVPREAAQRVEARPVVVTKPAGVQETNNEISGGSDTYRPGSDDSPQNDVITSSEEQQQQQEDTDEQLPPRAVEEVEISPEIETSDSEHHPAHIDDTPRTEATDAVPTIAPGQASATDWSNEQDALSDEDEYDEEDLADDESHDQFIPEEILSYDGDDTDDADDSDDLFDELALTASPLSLHEEVDDLSWDDLEDLEEFDETANRAFESEDDDDAVTREQRAKQKAVEVLAETDWDSIHLPLLQQVFIENGWSAARVAIEKAVQAGLQPEELAIAREIRLLWADSDQYWITFHKIKTNAPFCQADAAYKHLSWLEAIRIIRCFGCIPDIEEVYALIDDAYEQWYNSDGLRRVFKAFLKFLKYRTGSMRRTLPGDFALSFRESKYDDIGINSRALLSTLTPEGQTLARLGIYFDQWPRASENKIIKAHLEQSQREMAARKIVKETEKPPEQAESQPKQKPSFGFGSSVCQGT